MISQFKQNEIYYSISDLTSYTNPSSYNIHRYTYIDENHLIPHLTLTGISKDFGKTFKPTQSAVPLTYANHTKCKSTIKECIDQELERLKSLQISLQESLLKTTSSIEQLQQVLEEGLPQS